MNYQNNFSNFNQEYTDQAALNHTVSQVMKKVYFKMFLALLVTALTSLFVATTPSLASLAMGNGYWIFAIIEIGLVIWISAGLNKMSASTATLLFFLFAIVNGFTLSIIFYTYAASAIAKAFFITAGTFGAMSVYGYTTNSDLTKFGSFCMYAVFGLLIAMLVNFFMHSETLDWVISIVGVFLFLGLTAWDTQTTKRMAAMAPAEMQGKLATISALNLYLDFINLFLFILRIFGGSRD